MNSGREGSEMASDRKPKRKICTANVMVSLYDGPPLPHLRGDFVWLLWPEDNSPYPFGGESTDLEHEGQLLADEYLQRAGRNDLTARDEDSVKAYPFDQVKDLGDGTFSVRDVYVLRVDVVKK